MIRLVLVDDQAMIRQALAALLELESDLTVVGQAGGSVSGRGSWSPSVQPDVVLMDVQLRAGRDGRRRAGRHGGDHGRTPGDPGDHPDHLRSAGLPAAGDGGRRRRVHGQGRTGRPADRGDPTGASGSAGRRSGAGRGQSEPRHLAADRSGDRGAARPRRAVAATGAIAASVFLSEGTVRNHLSAAMGKLGAASTAPRRCGSPPTTAGSVEQGGTTPLEPPAPRQLHTGARRSRASGATPLEPPRQFLDVAEDRSRCPRGAIA